MWLRSPSCPLEVGAKMIEINAKITLCSAMICAIILVIERSRRAFASSCICNWGVFNYLRETGAMKNRVTGMLLGAMCVALTPALGWAQDKKADLYKADVLALSNRIDGFINKALSEAETKASAKAS